MPACPIAAVMIHVHDISAAFDWYANAFPASTRACSEHERFEFLSISGLQIEFVLADEKVSSGAAGSVVYWHVPNFEAALARLQKLGAILYRGPMDIEQGLRMCQVLDPWGNCIGLRGPGKVSRL